LTNRLGLHHLAFGLLGLLDLTLCPGGFGSNLLDDLHDWLWQARCGPPCTVALIHQYGNNILRSRCARQLLNQVVTAGNPRTTG
jgi:hypothetical protein